MNATRILSLALTAGVIGGTLGCAQTATTATAPEPAIPKLQAPANGPVAPDQLLVGERQTLVNGQAMNFDQIRQQLPARISAADAAKMLVKLDMDQVVQDGTEMTAQQLRIRSGGRFFHRGIFGRRSIFFRRPFFSSLSFFPYSSYYFPYYYNAGYYYPYTYSYANTTCSPYLYSYGARYWPYTYGWGGYGGYGGYGWGW